MNLMYPAYEPRYPAYEPQVPGHERAFAWPGHGSAAPPCARATSRLGAMMSANAMAD
jgi:hypothetical protein